MTATAKASAGIPLLLLLALAPARLLGGHPALPARQVAFQFHSIVPLGQDSVLLQPARKPLMLLASAESRDFQRWYKREEADGRKILYRDGSRVRQYPEFVDFRVTASTRVEPLLSNLTPYPGRCDQDLNACLLGLQFRLKIFHELESAVVEPRVVRMIGVPASVPYDERIYRISFKLAEVPLEDRIVLEVLAPGGNRIAKFHLEFY